ncbi:[FeFe] hydrogenase H-cluster radical SAM maturase HydE [Candidatus Desantisbacteria bacterium]|nr:[FeFe] hydrogenase H-cluster radical SAM maturase HydE [Candidatus Desantisbacteria bacterium]
MCYAIPGKITDIKDKIVTVDYFGEIKKARNEFYELNPGDYIYAQGGFVINKISNEEAEVILETWREFFFKLKEVDLKLTYDTKTLHQRANAVRRQNTDNSCCVHGIVEFSNYCINDCLYCGLRKSNNTCIRYRMDTEEIVETCENAVNKLGFKALVLQSGEDFFYDDEKLSKIINRIREKCAVLLVMSIGERDLKIYQKLYQYGARGVLLRFETNNHELYKKIRPGHVLEDRINLIKSLRDMGFLIMTGFLVGLPEQSEADILSGIDLTGTLGTDMFSFGPFIPHPQTPLAGNPIPDINLVLDTIARARMRFPASKILATTALETLDKKNGAQKGLLAGANSLMINVTPKKYQSLYELYPDRAGIESDIEEKINLTLELLYSLGRAPADIGI